MAARDDTTAFKTDLEPGERKVKDADLSVGSRKSSAADDKESRNADQDKDNRHEPDLMAPGRASGKIRSSG